MIREIGDFCIHVLVFTAVGILLGGFFAAIRKVLGEEHERPWEGWRR